jgi:molybdopterin-containing oxidoreductase family membrane subunit
MLYGTIVTMFFFLVESFTVFYSGNPEHMDHFWYLITGLEGKTGLVPWMWATFAFWVGAIVLLLNPRTRRREGILIIAAALVFVAMWIDKGLVLLVPGFVPSGTGGLTEYLPTVRETFITLGVWGIGLLVLTFLYKITVSVMAGRRKDGPDAFDGH